MTALDLAPIKARADAATEGPWERRDGEDYAMVDAPERPQIALVASGEDATFIAHARTDVVALCDEVGRLRKALRDLMEAVDHPMVREVWGMIEDGEGKYSDQLWATLYPWFEIKMNAYRTADALLEATP